MMLSQENKILLDKRMAELPEGYRKLLESDFIENTSAAIATKYGLDNETLVDIENEIVLTLLFFTPLSELTANLTTLVQDENLADSINIDFQDSLNEDILQFIIDTNERQDEIDGKGSKDTDVQENISAANGQGGVKPMPTVDTDAKRVHGYGSFRKGEPRNDEEAYSPSSQSDLLDKKSLTEIPKYGQEGKEDPGK